MEYVEKSLEVNVPVHTAYNQWTLFEDLPKFMEGVHEVRQLDDKHLFWRAKIGGKEETWTAEISDQAPDQVIAWHSTSGAENAGRVSFDKTANNRTMITLQLGYDPEGVVENVGDKLGFVSRRVEGDLKRFKDFIESRGVEEGGWRGEIHGPHVDPGTHPATR